MCRMPGDRIGVPAPGIVSTLARLNIRAMARTLVDTAPGCCRVEAGVRRP